MPYTTRPMQSGEVGLAQAPSLFTMAVQELAPAPGGFDKLPCLPLGSVGVLGVLGMAEPPKSGWRKRAQGPAADHVRPPDAQVQQSARNVRLVGFYSSLNTVYYQTESSLQSDLSSYH